MVSRSDSAQDVQRPSTKTAVHAVKVAPKLDYVLSVPGLSQEFAKLCAAEVRAGPRRPAARCSLTRTRLPMQYCGENLSFLIDANDWTNSFVDVSEATRIARFRHICRTYIFNGAPLQINVPSAILEHLVEAAQSEKPLDVDTFFEARRDIAMLLEIGPVSRFSVPDYAARQQQPPQQQPPQQPPPQRKKTSSVA
jgi:hypothetical protein